MASALSNSSNSIYGTTWIVDAYKDHDLMRYIPTALLTAAVAVLVGWLYNWAIQRRSFIAAVDNAIPGPPLTVKDPRRVHFWIGQLQVFRVAMGALKKYPHKPDVVEIFWRLFDEYKNEGIFRLWFGHPWHVPFALPVVAIIDTEAVRYLLTSKSTREHLLKHKGGNPILEQLVGDSFLSMPDGHMCKQQRKTVARGMYQHFLDVCCQTIGDLLHLETFSVWNEWFLNGDGTSGSHDMLTLEMKQWSLAAAVDMIGKVAFGRTFGSLKHHAHQFVFKSGTEKNSHMDHGSDLHHTCQTLFHVVGNRFMPFHYTFRSFHEERRMFMRESRKLNRMVELVIKERMAQQMLDATAAMGETKANTTKKPKDLLGFLMMDGDDGYKMPYKYIFGNVRMLIMAGHDTTAAVLTGIFWELAVNVQAQEKLQDEVDAAFVAHANASGRKDDNGTSTKYPTYKDFMQLKYLDAVIREGLRLYAPGPLVRLTLQDIEVPVRGITYTIPKGVCILAVPVITQTMKQYITDRPNQFVPERFLDETTAQHCISQQFAFSFGSRTCVGYPLAMAELKTVIAHVLHNYQLAPNTAAERPVLIMHGPFQPSEALLDIRPRRHQK